MKTTTTAIVALVLGYILKFASFICLIWTAISFILYLVKNTPFNWDSLYWTVGLTVATLIVALCGVFVVLKAEKQAKEDAKNNPTPSRFKSRFQKRLEQMAEEKKRNQAMNN